MSLMKRLEEINVDKKANKSVREEIDPYYELKMKIQNRVIEELDIDFDEISEHNQELKQKIDYIVTKHIEMESLNMTNNHKKK
nr:TPA_exp: hypothetical protein CAETHG_RS04170_2 [Clostridium autoethanogenum DSM 10061]